MGGCVRVCVCVAKWRFPAFVRLLCGQADALHTYGKEWKGEADIFH